MSVITYPPKSFDRCTRKQLLTLALALEAQRDYCIERLNAVHEVIEHARKVSPSPSMHVYVADLERALGRAAARPHKTGQRDEAQP